MSMMAKAFNLFLIVSSGFAILHIAIDMSAGNRLGGAIGILAMIGCYKIGSEALSAIRNGAKAD